MPQRAKRLLFEFGRVAAATTVVRALLAGMLICGATSGHAQSVPNVHPPQGAIQLTPLWSRLGDINGEAGAVEVAVLSPDAQYVVSGSKFDNQLIMWRAIDGTLLWRITLPAEIEVAAFAPDRNILASVGEDASVRFWTVDTGKAIAKFDLPKPADSLAWSPDGLTVAVGEEDGGTIRLFNAAGSKFAERITMDGKSTVNSFHFSADSKRLLSGHDDGMVRLWNIATASLIAEWGKHEGPIKSVRFSPDGRLAASGAGEGQVKIWDVESRSLIKTLTEPGYVEAVAFTPDGRFIMTGSHGFEMRLYRVADLLAGLDKSAMDNVGDYGLVARFPMYPVEYIDTHRSGQILTAHENGLISLYLLSSDPTINYRSHIELRKRQGEALRRKQAGQPPQ
jgi:WD40 repeat protein